LFKNNYQEFAEIAAVPAPILFRSFLLLAGLACLTAATHAAGAAPEVVLDPTGDLQAAPHGAGNAYAPEILFHDGLYRMWYGAQGRDGHDRILLAESPDGLVWETKGVALDHGDANHVNDPSVVKVGDTFFMYYTRAPVDVRDEIALVTSKDGRLWQEQGTVFRPGADGAWDSLLVGRPSVVHEDGRFRMWYDGRRDLPVGAPAEGVPKSDRSVRAVGYAESIDGLTWTRSQAEPVFGEDAGGVHVARIGDTLVMTAESREGTRLATSPDGLAWQSQGLLVDRSGADVDRFGHVTPFLLVEPQRVTLFVGAASSGSWDHNRIVRVPLSEAQQRLVGRAGPPSP
jgi:hypothetical protein